jgi:hypothetical protein
MAELGAATSGNDIVSDSIEEKSPSSDFRNTESTSPKGNYLISIILT